MSDTLADALERLPRFWSPTNDAYHAERAWWGSTMLKTFRESPRLAYLRFVSDDLPPEPPTKPMILGSLVHALLLEADRVADLVHVVDCRDRRAKSFSSAVEVWADRLVVTAAEWEDANGIADAILNPCSPAAEVALTLLTKGAGPREYAWRWTDPASGVPCKVKFDRLTTFGGCIILGDLKTAAAPAPADHGRRVQWEGYAEQTALYRRGLLDLLEDQGIDAPVKPCHLVVGNTLPHDVYACWIGPGHLAAGDEQVSRDLDRLAACLESGIWCHEEQKEIQTIDRKERY